MTQMQEAQAQTATEEPVARILLVGHPNVGKSVLFNRLSGSKVTVSNYPGTTVDLQQSLARIAGTWCELVDTPGTRSLVAASDDERVTQRCLLDSPDDPVAQIGDAKNLRRSLFLTTQIIELERPLVLALNMLDECRESCLEPRVEVLEEALGVPVRPTTAITGEGVDALERTMVAPRAGSFRVDYPEAVESAIAEITVRLEKGGAGGDDGRLRGARGIAVLFLAEDESVGEWIEERVDDECLEALRRIREATAEASPEALALTLHQARYDAVSRLSEAALASSADAGGLRDALRAGSFFYAVLPAIGALSGFVVAYLLNYAVGQFFWGDAVSGTLEIVMALAGGGWFLRRGLAHARRGLSARQSLGELSLFPSTALPLLALTLYAAYLVVGVFAAGTCVDFIESKIFASVEGGEGFDVGLFLPLSEHFSEGEEMLGWSLVHVPWKGINHYLASAARTVVSEENMLYQLFFGPPPGAPEGSSDMGLITVGLTYSVAIILPIVVFFFLLFSLLEDSGFLPRIAVLTDRSLKTIGLNGKAVLPLILGLGCDTMATMTTRILETRKERMIAILLLALAVPCSAQLGIISGVMARVSPVALFLFVAMVLGQLIIVGFAASRFFRGRTSDFIIEIPPVRVPLLRNVLAKTFSRMKWFLIEAVPLFVLGTFALFVVDRLGVIPLLVDAGRPVVTSLLGLPEQTTLGFLLGFLRRDFGAVHILQSFGDSSADPSGDEIRQVLVAVVVITLFVPCLANYFMMVREQGGRVATAMSAFIFPYAIAVGALLHFGLKFVPTSWLRG